jgi:hypothetical protein
MPGYVKISSQLALKMTSRHAIVVTLYEKFCHVWRFLMYLIGIQSFYFYSMPTDKQSDTVYDDLATVTFLAMSESSLNMP